jgi:hypothetical protein
MRLVVLASQLLDFTISAHQRGGGPKGLDVARSRLGGHGEALDAGLLQPGKGCGSAGKQMALGHSGRCKGSVGTWSDCFQ